MLDTSIDQSPQKIKAIAETSSKSDDEDMTNEEIEAVLEIWFFFNSLD